MNLSPIISKTKKLLSSIIGKEEDLGALLEEARTLFHEGLVEEAIEVFKRILKQDPNSYVTRHELGQALLRIHRNEEAVLELEQAHKIEPLAWFSLHEMGRALSRLQENDRAEQVFRKTLEIEEHPGTHCELSQILLRKKNISEAKEHLEKALQLGGDQGYTYFHLAKYYRHTGALRAALSCAEKAAEMHPEVEGFVELANILTGDKATYELKERPSLPSVENYISNKNVVLNSIEMALPWRQSGYTVRSSYIFKAQKNLGLSPIVSTRPGFTRQFGDEFTEEPKQIEEVPHYALNVEGNHNYNNQPLNFYLQSYSQELRRVALKVKADVIHAASNFKNGLAARATADSLGLPMVYEARGIWEETQVAEGIIDRNSDKYAFFKALETECLENADAVVTLSNTLKDEFVSRGISKEKIYIVPNAIDPELFPVLERNQKLAKKLKINNAPVIGYISSFSGYEGIDTLIKAFGFVLRKSHPGAKLLLVGDGTQRNNLEKLVEDLNIKENVIFTGKVPHKDVLDYYSLIDLFVVPRNPERVCSIVTPLKPYEAMSTGRTVIVSDLPALREMVIDGETGAYFRSGDPESLANICTKLLSDEAKRKTLAENAATWVRENRTWESVSTNYIAAYNYARQENARKRANKLQSSGQ